MPFKKGESGNANGRPKGARGKLRTNVREFIKDIIDENREKFNTDLKNLAAKDRVDVMVKLMGFVVPKPQSIVVQDMTPTDTGMASVDIDNAPEDIREGYFNYLDWAITNTGEGHDAAAGLMEEEEND